MNILAAKKTITPTEIEYRFNICPLNFKLENSGAKLLISLFRF
jgi:hypothetical protein